MSSAGAYFRASVRRELALPPVWIGRARKGGTVGQACAGKEPSDRPDLRGAADPVSEWEAIECGGCAPPVLVPKSRAKAGVEAEPDRVAKVEPVSRSAAGRLAAANVSEGVTTGETVPAMIARELGLLKPAPKPDYLRFVEAAKAKAAARPAEKPAPTRVAMSPEECKPIEQRADPEKYVGHRQGKHRRGGRQAVRI